MIGYRIGEAAERAGLPVKTVRYYADIGLVEPEGRSEAGYRVYGPEEVAKLAFVRTARAFGFSVGECRELLGLYGNRGRASAEVKKIALERLGQIEARLRELEGLRDELRRLADACAERGIRLFSDEVYREFVYDGQTAISALSLPDADEFVIVVDSLSKRYSACGIRLGALVTKNSEIYAASLRMAQGRLSPPGLAQFMAVAAETLGDDYTKNVVTEYQRRRDVLFEGLTSIPGVFLVKPEGAFYCVARLPVQSAEDFAIYLLSEFEDEGETVMVAPANGFYISPLGRDEIRIAYVLKQPDLVRAVELLRIALERYRSRDEPLVDEG